MKTPKRTGEMLKRAVSAPRSLSASELVQLLAHPADEGFDTELFAAAHEVKMKCGRTEVLPRGLVETSNVCAKDCLYCGIRKSNEKVTRYRMDEERAIDCVREAVRRGYPAVAFQAGEIESEANTAFYERLLKAVDGLFFSRDRNVASPLSSHSLEVTLSLGEQTEEVYRRWKVAAGNRILRYLIRIETSNRNLYARIHPQDCSFERRLNCIRTLKRLGYVTGSGVMIALPGQTHQDLANDIVFFGEERLDMVGMGPYVPNVDTPLCECRIENEECRMRLALRMIALTRLYMHDINIVAATALDALDPLHGRERGIAAGANVIMPVLTPADCKANYSLYPGKNAAR